MLFHGALQKRPSAVTQEQNTAKSASFSTDLLGIKLGSSTAITDQLGKLGIAGNRHTNYRYSRKP